MMLRRVILLLLLVGWSGQQACSKGNACRTDRDCPTDWNCQLGTCFLQRGLEQGSIREVPEEQADESQPETYLQEKHLWKEEGPQDASGNDGREGIKSIELEAENFIPEPISEGQKPDTSVDAVPETTPDATCSSCSWLFLGLDSSNAPGSIGMIRSVQGKSGVLYLALRFYGTISIGGSTYTAKGSKDSLLVKLDASGKFQWAQQWGASKANFQISQIHLDAAGTSLFLGGTFEGSLLLGSNILSSIDGTLDSYVARFDLSQKDFAWVHPFGSDTVDVLQTFVVDSNDRIHALVYSRGLIKMGKPGPNDPTKTFDDNMVMQFDSKGALQRTFVPKGDSFRLHSMACDAQGRVVLAGFVKGSLTFDKSHSVTTGTTVKDVSHLFLGELDSNYNVQWLKSYPTSEAASSIIAERLLLTKTKIVVFGSWDGASLFAGTPHELKTVKGSPNDLDMFVAEFDRQGKVLQTARWGDALSDYGFAILSDPAGGYYVGGSYGLDAFFSKSNSFSGAKPAFGIDPFALRLDAKLQPKWLVSIPGGSSQQTTRGDLDAVHQLHLDRQGCLTVVGFFRDDATLGCFGQKKMNFAGGVGVFVWRIGTPPP
ncbi:MAG: hypothetical protein EP343_24110 [Deltaproteobacteria bacterium]|nr:MAG: hypothetical protein EP343_24110 [Deltaproteobacteria bacterium]